MLAFRTTSRGRSVVPSWQGNNRALYLGGSSCGAASHSLRTNLGDTILGRGAICSWLTTPH